MKILIVASYNKGHFAPFVLEQVEALVAIGCEICFFYLEGKGWKGYLKNLPLLKQRIREFQPNIIHAHYGLSGLFANLQRKVPVVTTYHGSDINDNKVLHFSKLAMRLSAWNVFVSRKIMDIAVKDHQKCSLIPCGVFLSNQQLTSRIDARQQMHMDIKKRFILFSGGFDNKVKNYSFAKEIVSILHDSNTELLELKGYTREEVTLLMCAVDTLLMTSLTEGSPQVVKEALACGCPIVSVDVGDVKERVEGVEGCYVAKTREPNELSVLIQKAFLYNNKTNGREKIIADGLDNMQVAEKLMEVFNRVIVLDKK